MNDLDKKRLALKKELRIQGYRTLGLMTMMFLALCYGFLPFLSTYFKFDPKIALG